MSVNQDDDHDRYEHLFETPPRMGPARERPPSWDPESSLTAASTPSHRSNYHEETAPLQESPIPSYPLFSPSYAPETTASLRQPPAHAEPEPERSRRPSNLFPMRNQHRPDYWTFVRLVTKPAYAHLAVDDLVTDHAQAAYCLRCESCIPFRKGQNGVKKHMVKFHMKHLATYAKDKAKKREAEVTLTNSYSQSDPQSESKGVAVSPQQQSHVNELLALWIAGSLRPLSTVSDKGFSALIRYLTSDLGGVEVRLPSRTQVRADIAQQAAELRASLKNKLAKECGYYSVTTDIWTSRTARSFLALTVHYLTLQFQLCNWTLEVEHFPGRHSGAAIAEGLTSLLKRWGLDLANCTKLLRDGASNGVLAGNLLGIEHMSCIAHSLHLVLAGLLIKKRPTPSDASAVGASNARTPSVMIADQDPLRMQQPPEEDAGRATTTQTDNAWFEEPTETEAVPWQRERAWCELGDFLQTWVQLEERSAMGEVRDIVQRFRTIAVYFHKSPKAWNRLAEIQIERQARRPL
ncbi:hypothetical protein BBJ28_00023770 [Nothophytophthora sp. Chile5]|nr:hypothetical protein BBJ28_00023770 [Nothophytophthora sp. Chile5]